MTPEKAAARYGGDAADWRQLRHGAVAHKDADIAHSMSIRIRGPVVFRGGEVWGGTFYGGTCYAGTFHGGTFHGGTFYGGTFNQGTFRGGEFYGGNFHAGTFCEGTYLWGQFYRAVVLVGLLPWPVNLASPTQVAVGGRVLTLAQWEISAREMALRACIRPQDVERALHVVKSLPADFWPTADKHGPRMPDESIIRYLFQEDDDE